MLWFVEPLYLSPRPRAMMPRKISRVPPWIVNLGAINVV